jgi:iron complex outermembrane recepter protein
MITLRNRLLSSAVVAALASFGAAGVGHAADASAGAAADTGTGLSEVIVTARRIEENVQRVPSTVTAVNADQIRTQNIVAVMDLQTVSPSLTVASYFNDLNERFAVRGLSAGVTTYFADAPCCGGVGSLPFMDIGSVQVLNGPQGTLFGRSSAAGAVLIYPQKPNLDTFGGLVDFTMGDYGRMQGTGVVNIPVIPGHLGIRLAANANHVNGYTRLIGTSDTLDGVDNQQYRFTADFKAGKFENELIASYLNVDESATSLVFAAGNPNFASFNVTNGPAKFTTVCTNAVNQGFATNVNDCITQRTNMANAIGDRMRAEILRQAAGGDAARSTYPSYDGQQLFNKLKHGSVVNVTTYDFGALGALALNVKNIFSYDSYTSDSAIMDDGLGGMAEEGAFANAFYSTFGSNNEVGNRMVAKLGPSQKTYTEEFQLHGNLSDGLLIGTVGVFYQYQGAPRNYEGTTNFYKLFSGVSNANLGYNNAVGFIDASNSSEVAWFTQFTLNLGRVIHGLSLTAGYRYSWDDTLLTTRAAVLNLGTGAYGPGATPATTTTSSSGYNYTFSASEQFTDKVMGYVTVARAYVPGGVNALGQAATSLPSFSPTYQPETVLEEEVGMKTEFDLGGMHARLNFDFYNNDFSNIFQTFTGLINGTSVRYNVNIAAATLRGVEVAGTVIPFHGADINFGYSYNDARYTSWTGMDPFNLAKPGDAICVPSSPAGYCFLDLTANPFPLMPAHQGHVTLTYHLPTTGDLGDIALSGTVYAQSRVYYEATAARDLQLLPSGLNGVSQAPYATLNLRADWKDIKGSGWNAAVFINNVTDVLYATGKIPQLQSLGFSAANYAAPRMAGVQVWRKFGS